MEKLYDRIILLLCSSIFLLSVDISYNTIIAIGASIFLISVNTYFQQHGTNVLIFMAYSALCTFVPTCTFMLPLMSYDVICEPYRAVIFFALFSLVQLFFLYEPITIAFILIMILLAYFLRRRTVAFEKTKQEYLDMKGALTVATDHFKLQSKDLLERQDYEIKNATLNERNRIAREIHDTVGHLLSSALLQIGALLVTCKDENMKEALTTTKETLSQGMDNIRASIHSIYEESLDLNLKITELIQNFEFCEATLEYDITHDFSMRAKYSLISIIKEALNNIMKHSNATAVKIVFKETAIHYEITVHDNGTQLFTADNPDNTGMGIHSINERIESLGGHFHIDRTNGYLIYITLPLSIADNDNKN